MISCTTNLRTFKILRFWVVILSLPILPGIFFPLKVRPGSCLPPVDPGTRWDKELPCEARPPLKFHLFMTPWKPFPLLMPQMSTNWTATQTIVSSCSSLTVSRQKSFIKVWNLNYMQSYSSSHHDLLSSVKSSAVVEYTWQDSPLFSWLTCPGMKCIACIVVPTGNNESGVTRNSISFLFGMTSALLKWPMAVVFTRDVLASPTPSCIDV